MRKSRAEQDCLEGRSERPATGMGSPEPKADQGHTQFENLCYEGPVSVCDLDRHGYGVDIFCGRRAAAARGPHHHGAATEEFRRHLDR